MLLVYIGIEVIELVNTCNEIKLFGGNYVSRI